MKSGDKDLAEKAQSALTKINAVLPKSMTEQLGNHALYPINQTVFDEAESEKLVIIRRSLPRKESY